MVSLSKAIENNILFAHLTSDQRQDVFDAMFAVSHKRGEEIIKQGEQGDHFYIVDEGEAEVTTINFPNLPTMPDRFISLRPHRFTLTVSA